MKNENKNTARNGLLRCCFQIIRLQFATINHAVEGSRNNSNVFVLFFCLVCFPLTLSLVSFFLSFLPFFFSSVYYPLDIMLAHLSRPYPIAVAACSLMEPYLASLCREDSVRSVVCGLPSPFSTLSTLKQRAGGYAAAGPVKAPPLPLLAPLSMRESVITRRKIDVWLV